MADKVESLLLRLEKEVMVARKELNNLRREMNSTKKLFCRKFDDIQETVKRGFAAEGYHGSVKKRKEANRNGLRVEWTADSTDTKFKDEFCINKTIGYVQSCFKEKNGIPRQSSVCLSAKATLKIEFPGFTNPSHSLQGLEEFSHIWILFVFHKNTNKTVKAKVRPPRLNGTKIGVFSSRSPHRPNPIGLSLAKLDGIKGNVLYLSGIDILDGTPVLDIKPYIPFYDQPLLEEIDMSKTDFMEVEVADQATDSELHQVSFRGENPGKCRPVNSVRIPNETEPFKDNQVEKPSEKKDDIAMVIASETELHENEYSVPCSVQQMSFRSESPGKTHIMNSDSISSETDHNKHDLIEKPSEKNSDVSMDIARETELEEIDNSSPSSVGQNDGSPKTLYLETVKLESCDGQKLLYHDCQSVASGKDIQRKVGQSENKQEANDDIAGNDAHLEAIKDVTCEMRAVKVESPSDGLFLHKRNCSVESPPSFECVTSTLGDTQGAKAEQQQRKCCHDNPQTPKDKISMESSCSSPKITDTGDPLRSVTPQISLPTSSLLYPLGLHNSERSNIHSKTVNSTQQGLTSSSSPCKATLVWKGNYLRSCFNSNDKSPTQTILHQNCLHEFKSKQRSRKYSLDAESEIERRSPYQQSASRNRAKSSSSQTTKASSHLSVNPCECNVVASHDQEYLSRILPLSRTRYSPSHLHETNSIPYYFDLSGVPSRHFLRRSHITVPDWVKHPPIGQLNVKFTEKAKDNLMFFHGKDDIRFRNANEDICEICTENETAKTTRPSSPNQRCAYRLEFLSSRSSAKSAIIDILKSDPRSVYRRNRCPGDPYCFSVDVLNLTCKFEYTTVLVEKIEPIKTFRDEARQKESSEEEECLSSSAVQFDPSGNRVRLGNHHVDAEVILKNLKDVYDKNQKKTLTGSEQRITNARIDMVAAATAEIRGIKVYVQRCPESTRKTGDSVGAVELKVSCEKHDLYRTHFHIDLDSVYKTDSGDMVYWLDKVEVEERNKWELIIILEFVDGSFRHFQSKAFRIRTKPRTSKQVVLAPSTA